MVPNDLLSLLATEMLYGKFVLTCQREVSPWYFFFSTTYLNREILTRSADWAPRACVCLIIFSLRDFGLALLHGMHLAICVCAPSEGGVRGPFCLLITVWSALYREWPQVAVGHVKQRCPVVGHWWEEGWMNAAQCNEVCQHLI